MADDPGIPQTGDNSRVAPSGAAGHDPNHVQTSKKQRLVKNDTVMEFIANTIQSKMTEFGILLKDKSRGINKSRDAFTNLINDCDHVIMLNKQTTSDAVRNWITDGKVLAKTEKAKRDATSAAGRGNNDPPASSRSLHIHLHILWRGLISWSVLRNMRSC